MHGPRRRLRILFFMGHPGFVRNFESVLRELLERGHELHLAFDRTEVAWHRDTSPIDQLRASGYVISSGATPKPAHAGWARLARLIQLALDYLRYLEPDYRDAPKLRRRAAQKAPPGFAALARLPPVRTARGLSLLRSALKAADRALPTDPAADRFLSEAPPDVVLVTPLVGFGSRQADYVRSARRLGVATGLCVTSWDNLTNKGLIHGQPDLVAVWNEAQRDEAVRFHDVPNDRVVVTGAHSYDHWFGWRPSTTRSEFCARVGLPEDRPFVLYLCSSPFIAPSETGFVLEWLARLRASESELSEVGVLVRPHPQNAAQWKFSELEVDSRACVWPRGGADPIDMRSKAEYFDSICHCAAVVGINTSALIESAIVGKRVFTVLAEEFRETQFGTLHFSHVAGGERPLLCVAANLDEHVAQLAGALSESNGQEGIRVNRAFLERFVRPFGLARDTAPILADAIEGLSAKRAAAPSERPRLLLRAVLAPAALALAALPEPRHARRWRSALVHRARRPAAPRRGETVEDTRAKVP